MAWRVSSLALLSLAIVLQTWENIGLYHYYKQQFDSQPRGGGAPFAPQYPWLNTLLVAPCAVACALGIRTRLTAAVLTLDMLKEDADMIYHGISGLIRAGTRPNELLVKKVSVLGCIVLVLAGAGGNGSGAGVAGGMLTDERTPLASRRKSAALLLGRLLLSALFVYVGTGQLARLRTRSTMWSHIVDPTDGHDNLWLILQFALSLPFAAGYKTRSVTLGLAASLAAEAGTCWRFWRFRVDAQRGAWALGKYIHARSHFATNMAVAGGLLLLTARLHASVAWCVPMRLAAPGADASFSVLLQGGGAGRFTVDNMLSKKRE